MRTKRLSALVLAFITAFFLNACGNKAGDAGESLKTIGICLYGGEDPFVSACREKLERALTGSGYQVSVVDCGNDQSLQNRQIDDFIAQEVDGLVIIPCMTSAAEQFLGKLRASGIPTVLFHREVDGALLQDCGKVAYVGSDSAQEGTLQGQLILRSPDRADINGDQKLSYVLLQGAPDRIDTQLRTENAISVLRASGLELKDLGTVCCNGEQEKARQLCENLLRQHGPDIEVVICNDDAIALGALEAIAAAGRRVGEDIYLTGIGGSDQALEKIQEGLMTGTVANDVDGQVETVIQVLEQLMAGTQVEKVNYVDYLMITAENAGLEPEE